MTSTGLLIKVKLDIDIKNISSVFLRVNRKSGIKTNPVMLALFFIQGLLSVFLCAPIKVTDESKSYLDMICQAGAVFVLNVRAHISLKAHHRVLICHVKALVVG